MTKNQKKKIQRVRKMIEELGFERGKWRDERYGRGDEKGARV